jgi:hypothetical protein
MAYEWVHMGEGSRATAGMPERLLTLQETAEFLRLTPGALYTQRYRGEEPGMLGIRVGRKVLFRASDIDRFLDELREAARDALRGPQPYRSSSRSARASRSSSKRDP